MFLQTQGTSGDMAMTQVDNVQERFQLPALPAGCKPLSNEDARRLNADESSRWPSPAHCLTCGATRSFQWYRPGSDEVVTYDCPCEDQWELHRYLLNAGIGTAYQRLTWGDMTGAESGAITAVENYLEMVDPAIRAGLGLILAGAQRGTGKTALAVLAFKTILANGHDGYFTTFTNMIDELHQSWKSEERAAWFKARIRNTKVLVIDDVGRELKQRRMVKTDDYSGMKDYTPATAEFILESVLRHRNAMSTPTIITTNLTLDELTDHYGGHFRSLVDEVNQLYSFEGEDFRSSVKGRLADEVSRGLSRPITIG